MRFKNSYYDNVEVQREEVLPTADYEVISVIRVVENPGTPLERALADVCDQAPPHHRRPPRLAVDRPVRFRTLSSTDSVVGLVRNLSEGGAFIRAPQIPSPGKLLALGFFLEHEGKRQPVCSMARVVWVSSERQGFGLQFIQPSRKMIRTIRRLIRDHLIRAEIEIPAPDCAA